MIQTADTMRAALENKQDRGQRVPTGEIDREIRVRIIQDAGAAPVLDVRSWRRSPAEVSADAFTPTTAGITLELQFLPVLLEALEKMRAA